MQQCTVSTQLGTWDAKPLLHESLGMQRSSRSAQHTADLSSMRAVQLAGAHAALAACHCLF
jgi:hypothetical protein